MKDYWKKLLSDNPLCTKCGINPHAKNSQWCRACINERAVIRRRNDGGEWYKRLTQEQLKKKRARAVIHINVKRGNIQRGLCEVCGNPNAEGHHYKGYDPEHAKLVRWLCKEHHLLQENMLTP